MAKPLANGVPIGAIMTNKEVAEMIKLGKRSIQAALSSLGQLV